MNRRTTLKCLVQGAGLVAGAAVVLPSLGSAFSPATRRRSPSWRPLGRIDAFAVGEVQEAVIGEANERPPNSPKKSVYVWRPEAERFVVFSRACTDLGCPIHYDPGSRFYYCPCHGGIFNTAGEPVAGPPARPLDQYASRVRDGILEIDEASIPMAS
jgi:menaquinol-cytochrome c reductase iron-sulfur subunit